MFLAPKIFFGKAPEILDRHYKIGLVGKISRRSAHASRRSRVEKKTSQLSLPGGLKIDKK